MGAHGVFEMPSHFELAASKLIEVGFSDSWRDEMLAEMKDNSQVTIPKAIVSELGLKRGDMFDIVVDHGTIRLVPVVVYSREKANELEALAEAARKSAKSGTAVVYDDVEDLIADLHKQCGDGVSA